MLDRRLIVAPMMDWTDEVYFALWISGFSAPRNPSLLYGEWSLE